MDKKVYLARFWKGNVSTIYAQTEIDVFRRLVEFLENIFEISGFVLKDYIPAAIMNCSGNNDIKTAVQIYNDICEKYKQKDSIIMDISQYKVVETVFNYRGEYDDNPNKLL